MPDNERQFEQDIESFLLSPVGGWQKASDAGYRASMDSGMALDLATLVGFVQATQPIQWQRFEKQCNSDPEKKFYKAFENAVENDGLISVLRHGFKHRGIEFRVCYFKPESTLNDVAVKHYGQNICQCIRQWHYSGQNNNSVDMMLAVNGIPVVAIELKNQLTGQSVDNAKRQWMFDRDPKEPAFRLNHRVLVFFAVDLYEAVMTTKLDGAKTYFLPFNQGSNGPGRDGGAGNPPSPDGDYVTSYLWKDVLQKDNLLDIIQMKYRFRGIEHEATTWVDMYVQMLKELHNIDTAYLNYLAGADDSVDLASQFFRTGDGFEASALVVEGIYVNTGTSTQHKLNMLRRLFEHYDQDPSDLVFFLNEKKCNDEESSLRHKVRREYWSQVLPAIRTETGTFNYVSPTKNNYMSGSTSCPGVQLSCVANYDQARIEIYIDTGNAGRNQMIYDSLKSHCSQIEEDYGRPLKWYNQEGNRSCKLYDELLDVSVTNHDDWPAMIKFHVERGARLLKAVTPFLP